MATRGSVVVARTVASEDTVTVRATGGIVTEKGRETGAVIETATGITALDTIVTGIGTATGPGMTETGTVTVDAKGTTTTDETMMTESKEENPRLLMRPLLPLLVFHHLRPVTALARFALAIAAEAPIPETEAGMVVQDQLMMTTNLCRAAVLLPQALGTIFFKL